MPPTSRPGAGGAVRREPLRRGDCLRRRRAGPVADRRRSGSRRRAGAGHVRSRGEPGRARGGDARGLRLRLDAAGAVDHGRAGDPARPGVPVVARGIDVAPPSSTTRDFVSRAPCRVARSGRGGRSGNAGRPGVRRVALLSAEPRLGGAPCLADRAREADRRPAAGALRLETDPGELRDLSFDRRDEARALRSELGRALQARPPDASTVPGDEVRERLRALGYLPEAPRPTPPGATPKTASRSSRAWSAASPRRGPTPRWPHLSCPPSWRPSRRPLARRYRAIAFQFAGRYDESAADIARSRRRGRSLSRT